MKEKKRWQVLIALIFLNAMTGCADETNLNKTNNESYSYPIPITVRDLPGWGEDNLAEALPALRRSCERLTVLPPGQVIGADGAGGLAADWLAPCGALRDVTETDQAARDYFDTWFRPVLVGDGSPASGLFTGYYEAELHGSRYRSPRYRIPLYTRPSFLDTLSSSKPFYTRAEIEAGALRGRVPELLWVDDPVDAHILQIQGSGRIVLDDGSIVRIGYDGSNGYPFVGLGRILREHGKLLPGDTSMQSIREWLKSHPSEAPALMSENPRYVFFRLMPDKGPVGAQGVILTPGRSMAVDPRFIPLGVPVWLDSHMPEGQPLRRLMVAQDTGSAIKGQVRGDVFWGTGESALDIAGRMKSQGTYYMLLPRDRSGPVALNDR